MTVTSPQFAPSISQPLLSSANKISQIDMTVLMSWPLARQSETDDDVADGRNTDRCISVSRDRPSTLCSFVSLLGGTSSDAACRKLQGLCSVWKTRFDPHVAAMCFAKVKINPFSADFVITSGCELEANSNHVRVTTQTSKTHFAVLLGARIEVVTAQDQSLGM